MMKKKKTDDDDDDIGGDDETSTAQRIADTKGEKASGRTSKRERRMEESKCVYTMKCLHVYHTHTAPVSVESSISMCTRNISQHTIYIYIYTLYVCQVDGLCCA